MASILAIIRKDLRSGWRAKEGFLSMFLFAALVLVVCNFAVPQLSWGGEEGSAEMAGGVLWVAIAFAGVLGLNHTFAQEREGNCIEGLLVSPLDRGTLYLAKLVTNLVFLLLVEALLLPLFALLFNVRVGRVLGPLALVIGLCTVGYAAVGTLFSAMASTSRWREVLLPLLLLPVSVPILSVGAMATGRLLAGRGLTEAEGWVRLVGSFDVIFLAASYILFEHAVED